MTPAIGFKEQNVILQAVLAESPNISYGLHALERMRERRITRQDIRAALQSGVIVSEELTHETEIRWRVKGPDVDGNALIVVIKALQIGGETVIVVTTFRPR